MNLTTAWSNFSIQIGILIFITYIVVDGMYAYYTIQVTKKKPFSAATTGALMHFLLAVGVLSYVENYLYLIPLALGSWVGTYLVVRRQS
jgi:tryptophan-rich sensory protein